MPLGVVAGASIVVSVAGVPLPSTQYWSPRTRLLQSVLILGFQLLNSSNDIPNSF